MACRPLAPACCLLVALCSGALADWRSSGLLDSSGSDDHVALLQHGAQPHRRHSKAAARFAGRFREGVGRVRRQDPAEILAALDELRIELYCTSYPDYCKEPFNCLNYSAATEMKCAQEGWAPDGKPNFQSWCAQPQYVAYMARCAAGKLVEAGRMQFTLTEAGMFGGLTREADGSYCFIEGHCVNDAVTENTTIEEAAQLCDERFGREAWAHWGRADSPPEDVPGYASDEIVDPRDGFNSQKQTRPFLLGACAMGNFHCDVVYCKETYCKDEYYIKKYSHYLKDLGWVK